MPTLLPSYLFSRIFFRTKPFCNWTLLHDTLRPRSLCLLRGLADLIVSSEHFWYTPLFFFVDVGHASSEICIPTFVLFVGLA